MKIYVGCDHAAFKEKRIVVEHLKKSADVIDVGTFTEDRCDYPLFAEEVARKVGKENSDLVLGVLLCGSGIGVSIVANRFKNVRAALCRKVEEVDLARGHNNANILCVGARLTPLNTILDLCDHFLKVPFEGGRHTQRIDLFNQWGEEP